MTACGYTRVQCTNTLHEKQPAHGAVATGAGQPSQAHLPCPFAGPTRPRFAHGSAPSRKAQRREGTDDHRLVAALTSLSDERTCAAPALRARLSAPCLRSARLPVRHLSGLSSAGPPAALSAPDLARFPSPLAPKRAHSQRADMSGRLGTLRQLMVWERPFRSPCTLQGSSPCLSLKAVTTKQSQAARLEQSTTKQACILRRDATPAPVSVGAGLRGCPHHHGAQPVSHITRVTSH